MSNSFKINIFVLCFSLVQSMQIMPLGDAEINQTEVDRYKDGGDRANQRDKDAQISWFKRFRDSEAQRKYNNATEAQRQQDLQDDTKRATFIKMDQEGGWWDKWRNKEMIASAQRVEAQRVEGLKKYIEDNKKIYIKEAEELAENTDENKSKDIKNFQDRLKFFIGYITPDIIKTMNIDEIKNIFMFADKITADQKTALEDALKKMKSNDLSELRQTIMRTNSNSALLKAIIRVRMEQDYAKLTAWDFNMNNPQRLLIQNVETSIKPADLSDLEWLRNEYAKNDQTGLAGMVNRVIQEKNKQ